MDNCKGCGAPPSIESLVKGSCAYCGRLLNETDDHSLDTVDFYADDKVYATQIVAMYRGSVITVNEARELLGKERLSYFEDYNIIGGNASVRRSIEEVIGL